MPRLASPVAVVLTIAALVLRAGPGLPAAEDNPAVAAAQARQASVRTADIEFRLTEVIPRGAISEKALGKRQSKNGAPFPAEETTIQSVNRLVIDGLRGRYEDNHPLLDYYPKRLVNKRSVSVTNGAMAKVFYPDGMGRDTTPFGSILNDARTRFIKSSVLAPITMTFRGLDRAMAPHSLANFTPSGTTLTIHGSPCEEFALQLPRRLVVRYWLDATRGYVVRRVRTQQQGRLLEQQDIEYRRHERWGWVPASWVATKYLPSGAVAQTLSVEVLSLRLNEPQPAERFEIQFPAGLRVEDQRTFRIYRVQPDGSLREDFPAGEEAPAVVDQWVVWSLASVVVVLGILAVGYLNRRNRTPSSGVIRRG